MTQFNGFTQAKRNYYTCPLQWVDVIAAIDNLAELKIVNYILRHTWGFHEYGVAKRITNDELMHGRKHKDGSRMDKGTGLSKPSVIDGLRRAEEHGYIVSEVDDSDGGNIKKSYMLKMAPVAEGNLSLFCQVLGQWAQEKYITAISVNPAIAEVGVKDLYLSDDGTISGESRIFTGGSNIFTPRGKGSLPRTEKELRSNLLERTLLESNTQHTLELPTDESNTANADCAHGVSNPLFDLSQYQTNREAQNTPKKGAKSSRGTEKGPTATILHHPNSKGASEPLQSEIPAPPVAATTGKGKKPVMPEETAPWPSAETMVALIEYKRGRRYSKQTRAEELRVAKKISEMRTSEGQPLSRAGVWAGIEDMFTWKTWADSTASPMLKYLLRDDKILNFVEKWEKRGGITVQNGGQPGKPVPGQSITPGTTVSDEQGSFTILTTLQLSKLPIEQRRTYNKRYQLVVNAYRAAQKEKQAVNS